MLYLGSSTLLYMSFMGIFLSLQCLQLVPNHSLQIHSLVLLIHEGIIIGRLFIILSSIGANPSFSWTDVHLIVCFLFFIWICCFFDCSTCWHKACLILCLFCKIFLLSREVFNVIWSFKNFSTFVVLLQFCLPHYIFPYLMHGSNLRQWE